MEPGRTAIEPIGKASSRGKLETWSGSRLTMPSSPKRKRLEVCQPEGTVSHGKPNWRRDME